MIETMRLIEMTISIAITIIVFTVVIGNTDITTPLVPLFIQSFHNIFWIFFRDLPLWSPGSTFPEKRTAGSAAMIFSLQKGEKPVNFLTKDSVKCFFCQNGLFNSLCNNFCIHFCILHGGIILVIVAGIFNFNNEISCSKNYHDIIYINIPKAFTSKL